MCILLISLQLWKCKRTHLIMPLMISGGCSIHLAFFSLLEHIYVSFSLFSFFCRASVLLSVAETLKGFIIVYEGLSSFPEIFLPIDNLLHEILQNSNVPELLRDKIQDLSDLVKKVTSEHHMTRQPLQMRKQKPVPVKLLNPKFEEKFVFYLMFSFLFMMHFIFNLGFPSFLGHENNPIGTDH